MKDDIGSNSKILHEQIHSCEDPKIQLELIRHAANELVSQIVRRQHRGLSIWSKPMKHWKRRKTTSRRRKRNVRHV